MPIVDNFYYSGFIGHFKTSWCNAVCLCIFFFSQDCFDYSDFSKSIHTLIIFNNFISSSVKNIFAALIGIASTSSLFCVLY